MIFSVPVLFVLRHMLKGRAEQHDKAAETPPTTFRQAQPIINFRSSDSREKGSRQGKEQSLEAFVAVPLLHVYQNLWHPEERHSICFHKWVASPLVST